MKTKLIIICLFLSGCAGVGGYQSRFNPEDCVARGGIILIDYNSETVRCHQ